MNPTGRNVSTHAGWTGLHAPWLGTKSAWGLFFKLKFLSAANYKLTQTLRAGEWTEAFANVLYRELSKHGVYVTNLAKCTQDDARHLSNGTFKKYLASTRKEIFLVQPKKVVLFGNQVSSILLGKPVKVSSYKGVQSETLEIESVHFRAYPVYYPVGQGQRNMPLAVERIKRVLA